MIGGFMIGQIENLLIDAVMDMTHKWFRLCCEMVYSC